MPRIILGLGLILLVNACSANTNSTTPGGHSVNAQATKCPPAQNFSLPAINKNESFYDRFDFHIRNIVADADTVKFQALKQDFVFCRGNNTWTVQTSSLSPELKPQANDATLTADWVNPKFKYINFQGKTYQYRVVLDPKFNLGENNNISRPEISDPTKDQIVLELITPNSQNPQHRTLYTLKDLQNAAVKAGYSAEGNQLGFPQITSAMIYGDRIWWSVGFEQGEGNNGIATIVSYEPKTDKFYVIQPEALAFTQITDLAITGDVNSPTFWMGTNVSGEGNLYIPAQGLVAYRPDLQNPNTGTLTTYTVHNSPLVGAIPDKLRLEADDLWVSTANGVCQVKWQAADNADSWSCWRFVAIAKLPEKLPVYSALTNKVPAASLASQNGETVEVLWWSPLNFQTQKGRYEVRYPQGFTVKLNEGASINNFQRSLPPGKLPVDWLGEEWNWNGERFIRGWDEVSLNLVGGGPRGIGSGQLNPDVPINWYAMRGDLELLDLSANSTHVKYYSGWVDDTTLNPYLTVLPQNRPQNPQPNPLAAIAKQLPTPAR